MSFRIRLIAGVLAAGAALGTITGVAQADVSSDQYPGLRAGPYSSIDKCRTKAEEMTEKTRLFHFCRSFDGSTGLRAGWYVFQLV